MQFKIGRSEQIVYANKKGWAKTQQWRLIWITTLFKWKLIHVEENSGKGSTHTNITDYTSVL